MICRKCQKQNHTYRSPVFSIHPSAKCGALGLSLFIMAISLNSVILSRARLCLSDPLFCGSGERGVEGSAVSSAIMPILTDHRSLDSARAAHPGKSRRDAILARASLGMTIQCLLP